MKVYTRTGDKGETSLYGGVRVKKNSLRVEAYGEVDELNAFIGAAMASVQDREIVKTLEAIQNELFAIEAQLADPKYDARKKKEKTIVTEERILEYEKEIDRCIEEVGPLRTFVLPGGTPSAAFLHLARTVCRRAERRVLALSEKEEIPSIAVKYLNRLSDLLFMLALVENKRRGVELKKW